MEQQDPMTEESSSDKAKAWIQENLRIIISVFIVAAIALGIYSYSQRTQVETSGDDSALVNTMGADENAGTQDNASQGTDQAMGSQDKSGQAAQVAPESSQETETAFVERAEPGNGTTHMARRALAHYLEKNADSSLSAEQKVYIEDYLRKNVGYTGGVTTDTSISFSKDMIHQAIEKSKTLNAAQLQNLKQYSARVSAYR